MGKVFSRGMVWDLKSAAGSCRYIPLNSTIGMQLPVIVKTHGNDPVNVLCQAIPLGSALNQTFTNLTSNEVFTYSLDFPDESDVTSIQCSQYHNLDLQAEDAFWFDLSFPSLYMPLKIDDNLTVSDLWCHAYNASLKQPCYGNEVSIKSCVEGNPISGCSWKTFTSESQIRMLIQGENNTSWEDTVAEYPQCNNTRRCSTLTFYSLAESQQGFYWYECQSGLENTEIKSSLRTKSKMVKIVAQQSASLGESGASFLFTLDCQLKRLRGFFRSYGQNITAIVECKTDTGQETDQWVREQIFYEVPGPGAIDVVFYPHVATRETTCRFEGTNDFASERPLKFETPLKSFRKYNTLEVRNDAENDLRVCCDACAFGIRGYREFDLHCENSDGSLIEFTNETLGSEAYSYDPDLFTATRCRTMLIRPRSLYICKCSVRHLQAEMTVKVKHLLFENAKR